MKSVRDLTVKEKKVLVRADFNVPLGSDGLVDDQEDWRLRASLPTIQYLLSQQAKVILISHLGRPENKIVEILRLDPIARRLEKLLGRPVVKLDDCLGPEVEGRISKMRPGEIVLLENVRFYPEEEQNDPAFAQEMAQLGEIYINDAFGVDHRAHASLVGLPRFLPSAAGLLLEKELSVLAGLIAKPASPLVVIIGGAKIATKIRMIKNFLRRQADHLLLGGALANTVICAKGFAIGCSVVEEGMVEEIKRLELTDVRMHLPVDAITSRDRSGKSGKRVAAIGNIPPAEMILDIGPDSIALFKEVIARAKTIVWNGPMGLTETPEFCLGTEQIARSVAASGAFSVVGGGDTIKILAALNLTDQIGHISTGGGAMLAFLGGEKLPGIEALEH